MPGRHKRRADRMSLGRIVVTSVTIVSWVIVAVLFVIDPELGSRARLLYSLAAPLAIATTALWVAAEVFGNRLHAISYQIGYSHGRADEAAARGDESGEGRTPLRVVR